MTAKMNRTTVASAAGLNHICDSDVLAFLIDFDSREGNWVSSPADKHRHEFLPPGKVAALCLTVDDIHPGRAVDAYEAGGDCERGALRHLDWLLQRHPQLRATLFVTPDWRQKSPFPTRKVLARLPWIKSRVFLAPILPKGTMSLDRHHEFVRYLKSLPRTDFGLHGLHHVHTGAPIGMEFQEQSRAQCVQMLKEAIAIFESAGLPVTKGLQPPAWHMPEALEDACADLAIRYIASARDIFTPISEQATTNMSGLVGASLIYPTMLASGVAHISSNFNATCRRERAHEILDHGGILAIKAHVVKQIGAYVAHDGLDELYCNYLDVLLSELESRFENQLWFTTMGEIAERIHSQGTHGSFTTPA
jgi:hypothetical protein